MERMLGHTDTDRVLRASKEAVVEDAVIVSAVRTPVGSFGGQFKDVAATELGAHAVRAAHDWLCHPFIHMHIHSRELWFRRGANIPTTKGCK